MSRTLLTPVQVSEITGLSVPNLATMRYDGRGPAYVKLGKAVRYRPADVDAWIDANVRTGTADRRPA